MRILFDTHTHSIASGHAFSTVDDLARGASESGLLGFVLTDHGPAMPGGAHEYHFGNLRMIPERISGVRFLKGIEANILDLDSGLDLGPYWLKLLDFVMAGLHEACFEPRATAENTKALVRALENPWVDAVSHAGNPAYPIDARTVVATAARLGKAIEVNNASFVVRPGSRESCAAIARLCIEEGAHVVAGTDAHYWRDVGKFDKVLELFAEVGMPEELVINASEAGFLRFLEERKAAKSAIPVPR